VASPSLPQVGFTLFFLRNPINFLLLFFLLSFPRIPSCHCPEDTVTCVRRNYSRKIHRHNGDHLPLPHQLQPHRIFGFASFFSLFFLFFFFFPFLIILPLLIASFTALTELDITQSPWKLLCLPPCLHYQRQPHPQDPAVNLPTPPSNVSLPQFPLTFSVLPPFIA